MKHQVVRDVRQLLVGRQSNLLIALGILVLSPVGAAAQAEGGTTAVDAMRCWRRISSNAVVVGERFTMTVTCSVVETDEARTLPDQDALEPETIEVLPFDILNGQRYEDIRTGPYRFFQYQYTLRLISESDFGEDVEIPALDLPYRVERRVGDNPALLGRELTYILPAEPIRILSLVPASAADIRTLPPATFDRIETRALRATLLTLLAALFGLMALSVVAFGIVRIAQARGGARRQANKRLPLPLVVGGVLRELTRLRQTTAGPGWTLEGVARALAALRVAAAVAISNPIALAPIDPDAPTRGGQIRLRHGYLRPKAASISSGLTAATLNRRLEEPLPFLVADRETVEHLGRAIAAFTTARYGRSGALPQDSLTRNLETSIELTKRLRWQAATPIRHAKQFIWEASNWWTRVWTR